MSDDTINGIPRADRLAIWSKTAARIAVASGSTLPSPSWLLSSTGARSGERRDIPLAYFTDGGDVILIASNYGRERHPAWYHNLRAHPECARYLSATEAAGSSPPRRRAPTARVCIVSPRNV